MAEDKMPAINSRDSFVKLAKEMHTLDELLRQGLIKETEYNFAKAVLERRQGEL